MPECAGFRNALTLLRGRNKDLGVVLVMIKRLVVGNDFSDEFTEFDKLLRRRMYVLQNNKLVRVNDLAMFVRGNNVQVCRIEPRDLRAESLTFHIESHKASSFISS